MFITQTIKTLNIALFCCILSITTIGSVSAQQNIRVQGTIMSIPGSKPINNVTIIHDGYVISESDIDGKFVIRVPRDAKLKFHHGSYNEINVSVNGRQVLDLTMTERILEIEEVVVVGKSRKKRLTVEPTDIEIKGNYFHLKTRFRIPSALLTTDYRYIIQPTVYDVTKKERRNLRPVVIDGKNYTLVQYRYLDFDKYNDKLNPYIVNNDISKDNDIYSYGDSLYFDRKDINNDFRADCFLTLVTYRKPRKFMLMDTLTIAKGTQNVMRFFTSSLPPMNLDKTLITSGAMASLNLGKADSALIPRPEMKLMSSKGTTKIEFETGKSTIDYNNPINQQNIDEIIAVLTEVQNNEDATIKSITMIGHSSPDGNAKRNKQLADQRTKGLFNIVTESLSPDIVEHISLSSKGVVRSWSDVVELVEQDSLPIAEKLRDIVTKTHVNYQQWSFRRLPEYRKIIMPDYLPQLRKIEYAIEYSIFRNLTDAEIVERYRQGQELSRYEFFRLMLIEKNDKSREKIEDDAIKAYPNFTWAVNRVAIRTILEGKSNLKLQEPVLGKGVPMSMVYNQTLMALSDNNIEMADSLVNTIDMHPETIYLKAVVNALYGNYIEAYPVIGPKGGLNEILLLLGLKYNTQAYEKMKVFMQDQKNTTNAKAWYINALCANRKDDIMVALTSMGMALQLDPSLAEIAQIDSDLMDIYEIVIASKMEEVADE